MKLRSQMLLAGALTLAVPLVGWQSVKQLYSALQQTRIDEQTLKIANMRLALSESSPVRQALSSGSVTSGRNDWYAQSSPYPLFIDGYDDDWRTLITPFYEYAAYENSAPDGNSEQDALHVNVRTARRGDSLYLFITVMDEVVEYHSPPLLRSDAGEGELPDRKTQLINGDAIELIVSRGSKHWQHGLFRAIAPGAVSPLSASDTIDVEGRRILAGQPIPEWQAAWQKTASGYQLEASLPLPENGTTIGLAVTDVDEPDAPRQRWAGTLSPVDMASMHLQGPDAPEHQAGLIFHDSLASRDRLAAWVTPGSRARLFDIHGRLMADVNSLYLQGQADDEADAAAYTSDGLWDAILMRVFAFFVAGDLPLLPESVEAPVSLTLSLPRRQALSGEAPLTSRYVTDENDRVLGTLATIGNDPRRGYLLYEANEEHASAYAGSELARLFSLLLLVSLMAGCGLLIFATVLSSRIRRLSKEAQHAVTADGRVRGLPGSEARDEIGDLSRKLSTLLARSAAYTQYLEALSSRLSHELRTPLSVVRTSIENLDRNQMDEQSLTLIDRATGGADHLGSIIKALVESTRLEQTVQSAQLSSVNMADWMQGAKLRYAQVYPDVNFDLDLTPLSGITCHASPELLQQAFDKLVDNAVGFSNGTTITLHGKVERSGQGGESVTQLALSVANQGVALEHDLLEDVFEPMVSRRDSRAEGQHLGLGLYIVKMIAEAHGGRTFARNEPPWVVVGLSLPVLPSG